MQVIRNFWTKEQCDKMIEYIDSNAIEITTTGEGYPAYCKYPTGETGIKLATDIYNQLKDKLTLPLYTDYYGDVFSCSGVSTNFSLFRYRKKYRMKEHVDYVHHGLTKVCSTLGIIYLNSVETKHGGSTLFTETNIKIQPEQGTVLLFTVQDRKHVGCTLKRGRKYILVFELEYELIKCKNMDIRSEIFKLKKETDLWEFSFDKIKIDKLKKLEGEYSFGYSKGKEYSQN